MSAATIGIALLTLTARLYGEATVAPDVLARAERRVETLLGDNGVGIRWHSCNEPDTMECASPLAADEIAVRLLPGPPPGSADSCGVALVPASSPGSFISVFVDCVRRAAIELRIADDVVFGCAIAHEIGHLLLGMKSHGPIGLMQVQPRPIDWERAVHNALQFTSEESVRLQRALERRGAQRRGLDSR